MINIYTAFTPVGKLSDKLFLFAQVLPDEQYVSKCKSGHS
jgi:hypothetical protein